MAQITKKFSKDYLMDELDLPSAAIEDTIFETTRWSTIHDIIFIDPADGKHYATSYSTGATEYQDESPWEYEDEIEATEVELKEVTTFKYVPKEV